MFALDSIQIMHCGQVCHTDDVVSLWVRHIRRHIIWVCPITGDGNFAHLLKVVLASFLCCEATIFLFVINKYLVGGYFGTSEYPVSPHTLPTHFDIPWWFLPEAVITVVFAKCWFSVSIISPLFFNWSSSVRKHFPLSPMCVCVFMSVWTGGFLLYFMDYYPFNICTFYKLRSSWKFSVRGISSSSNVRYSCKGGRPLLILNVCPQPEELLRPFHTGRQILERSGFWRQAGPGSETRPRSQKNTLGRTRQWLTQGMQ